MNIKDGEHFLKTRHVLLVVLRDQEYFRKTRHILFLVSGDQVSWRALLKDQAYTIPIFGRPGLLENTFERPGIYYSYFGKTSSTFERPGI